MLSRLAARVAASLVVLLAVVVAPQEAAAKPSKARLAAFSGCDALLGWARAQAVRHPGAVPVYQAVNRAAGTPVPTAAPSAGGQVLGASGSAEGDVATSETNVQEAGVDEPDTVKARRGIVFTLAGGRIHALDARDGSPALLSSVDVPQGLYGGELLLHGDRLLLLASAGYGRSALVDVAVGDARALRVDRILEVDGALVSARRQGDVARVVLTSVPEPIVLPAPADGEQPLPAEEVRRRGVEALAQAGAATFLPELRVRAADGTTSGERLVGGCQRVRRPSAYSGLDVLSVLTLDLDRGIDPVDVDAVMASGDDVYASADSLYVAQTTWVPPTGDGPDDVVTHVHRFATGPEPRTTYRATGSVPGWVLNQFAFSEHRGVLRVATTERAPWMLSSAEESESFVTVLDERDGTLQRIGRVGGLGRGETIRAVRFLGDLGYVVTFRQTDPLYTVDLSDPRAPRVRGELKVLGYSGYLHPIGEDLLLGVGQDATPEGRRLGAQVSLFDVADPAAPRRLDRWDVPGGWASQVEWDHHAFLWWPATKLAVLPVSDPARGGFVGAVGLRAGRDGLREVGRVAQRGAGGWFGAVDRAVVVGERLLTFSDREVVTSRLADLGRVSALELPAAPGSGGGGPYPVPMPVMAAAGSAASATAGPRARASITPVTPTILPGRSIAGIAMGMDEEQVRQHRSDAPRSARTIPDEIRGSVRELRWAGLRVVLGEGSGVTLVTTTSRLDRTSGDVGVGSTERAVRRTLRVRCATEFGRRSCIRGRLEAGKVITEFRIGRKSGRVQSVTVARVID
ncbi:beta-propeller domain-containing protein [Conexibacter sp. SYSU D00693]|uniref:beta-propeller domain-containing protein n=1 Tax=Conexibacter sp. SYSU D00693 TaxID=2812560 RepID=UPI00196AEACF|nr:beta-propeller domain-containing protein [Conexibacter sp. SYSU D00693]